MCECKVIPTSRARKLSKTRSAHLSTHVRTQGLGFGDTPLRDACTADVAVVETLVVQVPVAENPLLEVVVVETPVVEIPADIPVVDISAVETPVVDVTVVETPAEVPVEIPVEVGDSSMEGAVDAREGYAQDHGSEGGGSAAVVDNSVDGDGSNRATAGPAAQSFGNNPFAPPTPPTPLRPATDRSTTEVLAMTPAPSATPPTSPPFSPFDSDPATASGSGLCGARDYCSTHVEPRNRCVDTRTGT